MGKAQYGQTEYVARKPAFLANFGKAPSPERSDRDLPSRPKDGRWAGGSDDENESDGKDEWEQTWGGGEGPQVVVLKEGRHLSADEVARERRRAAGLPSPPPEDTSSKDQEEEGKVKEKEKEARTRPTPAGKRKLVGEAVATADDKDKTKKKKKKVVKGLLSFDEAEGE